MLNVESIRHESAGFPPASHRHLEFRYRRIHQTAMADPLLRPLAARYRQPPSGVAARSDRVDVEWALRMPVEAMAVWANAGRPGQRVFNEQFRPVSAAIQESLRAWLPFVYFHDAARFEPRDPARGLLVYASMPPYVGTLAGDFNYDPTNPAGFRKGLRQAAHPLATFLGRVYPFVSAAIEDLSRNFLPSRAAGMTVDVVRHPRWFGALIGGEQKLTEAFISYADSLANDSGPALAKISRILDRMFHPHASFGNLAELVLIEATAAMAAARGRTCPVEAVLYISDTPADPLPGIENNFYLG